MTDSTRDAHEVTEAHAATAARQSATSKVTMSSGHRPQTAAVRVGIGTDEAQGAVVPPIYLSSTFSFRAFGEARDYDYTRAGNPTRDVLGTALAELEGGAGGVVTCTGTAAMTTIVTALTKPGDVVLIPHDCYGGTWRLFVELADKGYLVHRTVDFTDPAAVDRALAAGDVTVVWLETPSNPLLRITDIAAVTAAAKAAGATVVADNTFLSPLLQQPLALGVDLVFHSTTKYINGHSDVVGGAIVSSTDELHERMTYWSNVLGVTGAPFDSYLTARGLRSLPARLRVHEENARVVAELFASHPAVAATYWPGLPDHPGHDIAARQQRGFGSIVSLELAGGEAAVRRFVDGLTCFSLAESLGGTESLVDHPATMTHLAMTDEARAAAGVTDGLLRLSIGIEDPADLVADLTRALDRALATSGAGDQG